MELVWFLLGIIAMAMIWGVRGWVARNSFHFSAATWGGIATVIFLVLFTLAWVISSIEEGESQAAGMGLLLIGGSSLVVFALTRKMARRDTRKPDSESLAA